MDKTDQFSPPLVDILNKRMGLRDQCSAAATATGANLCPTRQTLLTSPQFDRNLFC
jgi:hypothetical protein